jgi:hypothetical protein
LFFFKIQIIIIGNLEDNNNEIIASNYGKSYMKLGKTVNNKKTLSIVKSKYLKTNWNSKNI